MTFDDFCVHFWPKLHHFTCACFFFASDDGTLARAFGAIEPRVGPAGSKTQRFGASEPSTAGSLIKTWGLQVKGLNMPKNWLNSYPTSTGRGLGGANAGFLHWAVFFPHPAQRRVPVYLFAKFQVLLQPLPLFIRFHQFSPCFMVIQHLSISTCWCR